MFKDNQDNFVKDQIKYNIGRFPSQVLKLIEIFSLPKVAIFCDNM